jgi:predicted Fe-Mo cluster-binding NifX family protein
MISPVVEDSSSTAGELFAQQLLQSDVSIILANHISLGVLKSFLEALRGTGIQIINGMNGSVRSVVRQFKEMCMGDTVVIPSEDIMD